MEVPTYLRVQSKFFGQVSYVPRQSPKHSSTRRVKVNQVATDVLASRSDVTIRDMRHMDPQLRLVLPPVHLERISILPERNTYIQDFETDLIVIAKRL